VHGQTANGFYSSEDFGQTWRSQDSTLPRDSRIVLLAEAKGGRVLAGTEGHGLFLSDESRKAWRQIGMTLPGVKITAALSVGSGIYAAVFRHGVHFSPNEGKNWFSQNSDLGNTNVRAILDVDDALLAATDGGISKRPAGQTKWRGVFFGEQIVSLNKNGATIVAGAVSGTLLSTDQGETWQWISRAGAAHSTAIIDEKIVVLNISGDLLISENWGRTWLKSAYHPSEGGYVYDAVNAGSHWLLSNNYGIHRSTDSGRSWELIFKTEDVAFLDLIVFGNSVYGAAVGWHERRGKTLPTGN
jgi:photosystem II stability/assembly factor-like uncharacterized protein